MSVIITCCSNHCCYWFYFDAVFVFVFDGSGCCYFFCHVFVVVGFIVVVAVVLSFVVKVAVVVVVVIFKAVIHAARMVTELFHRGVQTLIQITQKPFFLF